LGNPERKKATARAEFVFAFLLANDVVICTSSSDQKPPMGLACVRSELGRGRKRRTGLQRRNLFARAPFAQEEEKEEKRSTTSVDRFESRLDLLGLPNKEWDNLYDF
jgi:hypothetical protein